MTEVERLLRKPAVGLGVAITIGLALGSGALSDLLPFGKPKPPPAPATPAPAGQVIPVAGSEDD